MKIIMISGKAENGKSTIANMAREYCDSIDKKSIVVGFASYLKYIAKIYLQWNGEKSEYGRSLLQQIGTDFRSLNKNYWVDNIINILFVYQKKYDYVFIDDNRYINEIERMKEFFGPCVFTIRVNRPSFENNLTVEQRNHISETNLDNYKFDYLLYTNSIEEKRKQIIRIMEGFESGKY